MTATEELRRLLDERNVEWGNVRNDGSESEYLTEWQFDDYKSRAIAVEWAVGSGLSVEIRRYRLTPAQAIAATLGAEDAYTREDVEGAFVSGYSLGCLPVGSDPTWDQNEQTVDEYMAEWGWVRKEATLESGSCRYELKDGRFVCSSCGRSTWAYEGKGDPLSPPNFCPKCGAKVVNA